MNFYLHGHRSFTVDIPERYRKYILAGAAPLLAELPGGDILVQQINGIGYHARYDHSFSDSGFDMEFTMGDAALSLLYLLEGTIRLDGLQLESGNYYLCCMGTAHSHSISFREGRCRMLQIDVADVLSRYAGCSYPAPLGTACMMEGNIDYRMLLLIDTLLTGTGTPWELELLAQATVSGLVKLLVGVMESLAESTPATYGIRKLQAVRDYIAANIAQPLRIQQLAALYGGSVTKLNKEHRKNFRESLQHYIHKLKMERALLLLHDRKITVNEVAELTGYKNANNFTRAFTAYFGYTPSAARKQDGTAENDRI